MSILSKVTGLGLPAKIGLGIGAIVIIGLIGFAINQFIDGAFEAAEEKGAAEAIVAGQDLTLEQTGNANDAGNKVRNNVGFSKYCQCVRDAAAGSSGYCSRYRPDKHLPDRPENPCTTGTGR